LPTLPPLPPCRWPVFGAGAVQVLKNKYRIEYRHPHSGGVGLAILDTAAEMAAEKSRFEALGYVVTEVFLPLGKSLKSPPIGDPRR
jgi:hypothetical protein